MPDSPLDVFHFPENRYALARPLTIVDADVILRIGREIAFHSDWQPGFTEVWDMTWSKGTSLLPSDIPKFKALEEETKTLLEGSTTIVVTSRSMELYSVLFYAKLVKPMGRTVMGVRTPEEAAEILGIAALPRPE